MSNTIPVGVAGLNATYGNPSGANGKVSEAWRSANIVAMPIPWPAPYNKMRIAWDTDEAVRTIAIHRLVAPDLKDILEDLWATARKMAKEQDGYDESTEHYDRRTMEILRKAGVDLYGGGFNYRLKRGGRTLSTHSWGCAIDLSPEENGMGDSSFSMPLWVAEIFEVRGWIWGGRWKGKSVDAMHFQRAKGV